MLIELGLQQVSNAQCGLNLVNTETNREPESQTNVLGISFVSHAHNGCGGCIIFREQANNTRKHDEHKEV